MKIDLDIIYFSKIYNLYCKVKGSKLVPMSLSVTVWWQESNCLTNLVKLLLLHFSTNPRVPCDVIKREKETRRGRTTSKERDGENGISLFYLISFPVLNDVTKHFRLCLFVYNTITISLDHFPFFYLCIKHVFDYCYWPINKPLNHFFKIFILPFIMSFSIDIIAVIGETFYV